MYSYLSVYHINNPFFQSSVLSKIKTLLNRYKNVLTDDYSFDCFEDLLKSIAPHLYAGFKDGEFIGFVYLTDWKGGMGKCHCCTMTVCIEKKFWGKTAREASRSFISKTFKSYNLHKLKALVFEHNRNAANFLLSLGFKNEAYLKGETFKNGKPANMFVYSVFRDDFN